jgi:hypothetical protein
MRGELTRKGYGRIYVDAVENIERVKEVIQEVDEYEFTYMPKDLIAVYTEYPKVVYTHKFCDMDMDKLTALCWKRGIKIWVFDSGHNEYPTE